MAESVQEMLKRLKNINSVKDVYNNLPSGKEKTNILNGILYYENSLIKFYLYKTCVDIIEKTPNNKKIAEKPWSDFSYAYNKIKRGKITNNIFIQERDNHKKEMLFNEDHRTRINTNRTAFKKELNEYIRKLLEKIPELPSDYSYDEKEFGDIKSKIKKMEEDIKNKNGKGSENSYKHTAKGLKKLKIKDWKRKDILIWLKKHSLGSKEGKPFRKEDQERHIEIAKKCAELWIRRTGSWPDWIMIKLGTMPFSIEKYGRNFTYRNMLECIQNTNLSKEIFDKYIKERGSEIGAADIYQEYAFK